MKYFEIRKNKNIKKRLWFFTIVLPGNNETLDNNLEDILKKRNKKK